MSGVGRYRSWLVAAVAAVLLAGLAVVATPQARDVVDPSPQVTTLDAAGRPVPPEAPATSAEAPRAAAVAELLRRRAEAVLRRDEATFLATLDPNADSAFNTAQRNMFVNLAGVPLSSWRYQVEPAEALGTSGLTSYAPDADELYSPRVELSYAIGGGDAVATTRPMGYLFARYGDSWYLTSDSALEAQGRRTWRGPWDFGPCQVLTTNSGIVLGHRANQALAQRVAKELDAAVRAVSEVWGREWSQRVVVVLPETTRELQAMVGSEFAVDSIAAVALADRVDHEQQLVEGARIVFNPKTATRLSASALRVVLRHEITHVAARAATVDGAPMWLLEGFADYVGYRGSGIAPTEAAPDLTRRVRAQDGVLDLPADTDFRSGGQRLDVAYQSSWSLSAHIAERYGEATLVELYRRLARAGQTDTAGQDRILREVLGIDRAKLLVGWREFLRKTYG
ncbi:basic secretory family protein [Crossiella sp. SN42]|uniref:basic secretory family protein n=1 Tax=Crossiella sp. SN42 TaxID=2944808 RepID=UPI00207C1896|nr:basic secretory family protein [Crossiella sp. SN42]MCO1581692.1 basic secretory family protein [Crossiella sp. SN42]